FMRAAREMPFLRPLRPIARSTKKHKHFPVSLPTGDPLDKQLRAAVFDGGLSADGSFQPFAVLHSPQGIKDPVDDYVDHGIAVTSAILFGPLSKGVPLSQPFGCVDHF